MHLTVAAYLAGADQALPTEQAWPVIAGFDPDLTYRLTDNLTSIENPSTWTRKETADLDHEWVCAVAT